MSNKITKHKGKVILKNSTPVENYRDVLSFMCVDRTRSIRLTSYMKDSLTELFGKHNQRYKGKHFYYVWVLEFSDEIFYLYTHSERGTDIEISADYFNDKKTKVCISFLNELDKLLKEKLKENE